ncbi:hypothetical protein AUR64_01000 [Haloprofundus marisrubri]|uniref:DUF8108 domain-containing protein n=1 Tax=Haloprofundus marisrubri TaxID=1514971 RepID=A0A0W1R4G1_9EURY|nr:hypothetical protein [Haloprofundus marisrubri]KTG08181.1 hypothetical protein AUR64_01000 [Haloprofundus marisrubri]
MSRQFPVLPVALTLFVLVAAVAFRGLLLSVGRVVFLLGFLALVVGAAVLLIQPTAYSRTTFGPARRVVCRPLGSTENAAERDDGVGIDADGSTLEFDCVACDRRVTAGESHRFVREFVVAGVPLVLLDDGENRYCRACAADERGEAADEGDIDDAALDTEGTLTEESSTDRR